MTPGALAKRSLDAHRAIVAACEALSERFGVPVPEVMCKTHRGGPLVQMMKQREGVAQFLEDLVIAQMPTHLVADVIAKATDDELLALPGIGKATLARLRGHDGGTE